MNGFKKATAVMMACGVMGGCASHAWAPGPNARGTFDQAKGQCSLMASHSGGGFAARGSSSFVAGAAAGAAIGNAVQQQGDFNNCMLAAGWEIADPKRGGPTPEEARAQGLVAADEYRDCVSAIRVQPKYESIRAHMSDLKTGRYTFAQMSDESLPTVEEAALVASFEDETQTCRDAVVAKIASIDARTGAVLKARYSDAAAIVLELISRKLSWGAYARRVQALQDQAGKKSS